MTPRQNLLARMGGIAGVVLLFGTGAAWADAKRDIKQLQADKAAQISLTSHVVSDAAIQATVVVTLNGIASALCVGEKNPYKRALLRCVELGIR